MKNFLTQWETKEKNRKIGGNVQLIDRERSGNMLLIERKCSSNMLLINRKLAKLENDAEYASLPKLIKLVKKPSNLTRIRKEKSYCLISYSLTYFIEPIKWLFFCFAEGLTDLTNGLAISGIELRGKKVAISFFG